MFIESEKKLSAATLAQGVRTYLTAIVGFAEMLKLGIDDPIERRKALDSILASSREMMNIVNGVGENPAVEEERRRRLSSTQVISLSVTDVNTKVRRVLIVDDSPVNLAVLRSMVKRFGINDVVTAVNGREALELLMAGPAFDLVFTDIRMPIMDGPAFVQAARKNPAFANLRIFAITADAEAQNDFSSMGFSGLLLKPLTLQKIKELL